MITKEERKYLMESMESLLTEYDYDYTEDALNKIIDEWASQKESLITAFKKHPNYVPGKFMIALGSSYEREINVNESTRFSRWLCSIMPEMQDKLPAEIVEAKEDISLFLPWDLYYFLLELNQIAERNISEETATRINDMIPSIHAREGQKTSRVINKICCYLGYDKADGYNREFAKYADSLSPLTIKRNAVLSINPLDYLTMSFGNSWASCHTIDKKNKRGMPNNYNGMYSSGTMSYMLDQTSMVFYTVGDGYKGDTYWDQPKVTRQMFHWGHNKLVQGRLYPQDNDHESSAYAPNRAFVQEIISIIFQFPNLWTLKRGIGHASYYVESCGTHYRDYRNFDNCTLSIVQGNTDWSNIIVGAQPICVKCGVRHYSEENINHCGNVICCADCGEEINVRYDNYTEIDGEYYCMDCVTWCSCCDRYHRRESFYLDRYDIDVCEYCLEEYYVYCEDCGQYVYERDATWVEGESRYVCNDCLYEDYERCEVCGEYFRREDMALNELGLWLCEEHNPNNRKEN